MVLVCALGASFFATLSEIIVEPVKWGEPPLVVASTASTIEVDVMPFLGRTPEGGPFNKYYLALSNLGADFVRFAPWCPYPKVVVTELTPPDCTATRPSTNWNSTLNDAITEDFMKAVCGPNAAKGECKHSVAQQLSTMPAWLYVDGYKLKNIAADPWQYLNTADQVVNNKNKYTTLMMVSQGNYKFYEQGMLLHDESCKAMAAYVARVVGWYTQGGFNDTCGHWHASDLRYNWTILSVLNENEHNTGEGRYTKCFDAIRSAVRKVHPTIQYAGPEGTGYTAYVLDPANHKSGTGGAPDIMSIHNSFKYVPGTGSTDDDHPPEFVDTPLDDSAGGHSSNASSRHSSSGESGRVGKSQNASYEGFFDSADQYWMNGGAQGMSLAALNAKRDALAPNTQLMLNEYIAKINEWCDPAQAAQMFADHAHNTTHPLLRDPEAPGCPAWTDPRSTSLKINRATMGWSAAAAVFAYGYQKLALLGYKLVGADQLVGGPWPDNEPAVSMLDWKTGEPNAKYFATQMLAKALGSGNKSFFNVSVHFDTPAEPSAPIPVTGCCGHTDYTMDCAGVSKGSWNSTILGITNLTGCASRVMQQCPHANFVSFSSHNEDCSWYETCDLKHLKQPAVIPPYLSEQLHPTLPVVPPISVLPYQVHDTGKRGFLVVCKSHRGCALRLKDPVVHSYATVLEGTGAEPGFAAPSVRSIGGHGALMIGPYGVALVE